MDKNIIKAMETLHQQVERNGSVATADAARAFKQAMHAMVSELDRADGKPGDGYTTRQAFAAMFPDMENTSRLPERIRLHPERIDEAVDWVAGIADIDKNGRLNRTQYRIFSMGASSAPLFRSIEGVEKMYDGNPDDVPATRPPGPPRRISSEGEKPPIAPRRMPVREADNFDLGDLPRIADKVYKDVEKGFKDFFNIK